MQEMEMRKKIFLIIGLGLLVVVGLILLLLFWPDAEDQDAGQQQQQQAAQQQPAAGGGNAPEQLQFTPEEPDVRPVYAEPDQQRLARQQATIFVERFGTFSNQNENEHLKDVEDLVTAKMKTWVMSNSQEQALEYAGVTTQVISSKVTTFADTRAEVAIGVQQQFSGQSGEEVQYRNGRVELVKSGEQWLVDGYYLDEEILR